MSTVSAGEFEVRDINLAEAGKRRIEWAEREMPVLRLIREKFGAEKPLEGLSGGERRRLSLAILVHSGANVLILDEPTNHLDLESREALEAALIGFHGSLLLVSHDRALLDAVGTRTIEIHERALHSYVGGWPEYLRVREERAREPDERRPAASLH